MGAPEDILDWSNAKLSLWRQDALRRIASSSSLSESDENEVLDLIKEKVGFQLSIKPPAPIPLAKTHLSAVSGGTELHLKAIQNIKNVNRLVESATLSFSSTGLTIVYGRNGSGKSGFVRIFRTACRTRTDNPNKLKVLGNVYGPDRGPLEAEIVINLGADDVVVPWKSGTPPSEALLPVAVFDSTAAQLYVDQGNQIQFLPFGLDLPFKLNELVLRLKEKLESERRPIAAQLSPANFTLQVAKITAAKMFLGLLNSTTTDEEIDVAINFSEDDTKRLAELVRILSSDTASGADISALAAWTQNLSAECDALESAYQDFQIAVYQALRTEATEARNAAEMKATDIFSSEPLRGVGGDTWRRLWLAAREYSITDAYPDLTFPVVSTSELQEDCVLCQQPLGIEASTRLQRFEDYISGSLSTAADNAEARTAVAAQNLFKLEIFEAKDWEVHLEQIRKRDPILAEQLITFKIAMIERRALATQILESGAPAQTTKTTVYIPPQTLLNNLSKQLVQESADLTASTADAERLRMTDERDELADRGVLKENRAQIIQRRELLKQVSLYDLAIDETQTRGITQKAGELVELHLTNAVLKQYETERKYLDITQLKVGLQRKSGQTKATFQSTPGTTLTKLTSDILSEGEQRALALASFFTEISVTEGAAPIVIDDPVSSLDRERGLKVAARIADEAKKRQVIVFTHDLVFFNDLCGEADSRAIPTETIALFSDGANSGKVDAAGVAWKGQKVAKRLAVIENEFSPLKKLHASSPTEYEYKIKSLYGRLRDCYERLVEECIFYDVVRRGVDRIETQKLRYVHLSHDIAVRFHQGMTAANTHSHDNPPVGTVSTPTPQEVENDLNFIKLLISDLKAEQIATEKKRPSMKPN